MIVRIPSQLHSYTGGADRVELAVLPTLGDAMKALDARYPGLRFRVIDEQGAVRPHIKVFVNRVQERSLAAALAPADEVLVVAALSGG